MKKIFIQLAKHSFKYPIYVGSGVISKLVDLIDFARYSSITVISDSTVFYLHGKRIIKKDMNSYIFKAGEKSKTLETVHEAYKYLAKNKVDRKGLVINLGGGVVTDLGGFVASTYLRGIHFINVPTTIEAMVDASFGGKNGVNLGDYKNYIGTFTQPQAVIADVDFLKTQDFINQEYFRTKGSVSDGIGELKTLIKFGSILVCFTDFFCTGLTQKSFDWFGFEVRKILIEKFDRDAYHRLKKDKKGVITGFHYEKLQGAIPFAEKG